MKSGRIQFLALAAATLALLGMARPPAATPAPSPTPAPKPEAVFATPPPALEIPPDSKPFADKSEGTGMKVDTGSDDTPTPLTSDTELTILFPDPIVAPERIDAEGQESPVTIWPDLNAKWVWRTQTQGAWTVNGPLIPGQEYHMRLREGLKSLAGDLLAVDDWGLKLATPVLTVSSDYEEHSQLSAQPQVPLEFNYPIQLLDAAAGIWVQDRATRQHFPVDVMLNRAVSEATGDVVDITKPSDLPPPPTDFRVKPRDPLPVGHYYDLVVDNVHDAYAGRTLPYPRVFALGTTQPLAVDYVAARNWSGDKPYIEVKFTADLGDDPLPQDALVIAPAVPHLSLHKDGEVLTAEGDFDTSVHYKVTVSDRIVGDRGYTLAHPSVWGATFHPKDGTILFPTGAIRQRAALGLRFALIQANTGPITWRLAPVPLDQLASVQEALKADPQTVALVDSYHLTATATGEIPSSMTDKDELRSIEWKPAAGQHPLSGPYLLEATAKDGKGSMIANHTLLYFNESVFTQKTMPSGVQIRVARMGDAQPEKGVTVKALTAKQAEIARAVTDENGVVFFPSAAIAGAAFFAADTPGAQSVEPVTPGSWFSDTGSSYATPPPPYLGTIVTDRPLYRPGEEVKIKGLLRANADGKLTIPANAEIAWQIDNEDRDERVAEGKAKVNAFGGWDAHWTTPPQGRLGGFKISAQIGETVAGENGSFRVEEYRVPAFSVVCEVEPPEAAAVSTVNVSSEYFHGAPNVGSRVKWTATWTSDSDGEFYNDDQDDHFKRVDLYSEHHRKPAFQVDVNGETVLDQKGHATLTCQAPFRDPGLRARSFVTWRVDVTGPDGQTITGGLDDTVTMNDVTLGVRADETTGVKQHIAFDLKATSRDASITAPAQVEADLYLVQTKTVKERLAPFVYQYENTDVFVPIEQKPVPANGRLDFTPKTPGRYVLVVSPLTGQPGITVSDEIYLAAEGEAEVPVQSDQKLTIRPVEKDKPAVVGTNEAFDILAPSAGIAWVTVETDRVLDAYTFPIEGNSSRIEIPVKAEYAPNVHVCAYLLRPGGGNDLPGEMYGSSELKVTNPAAELKVAVAADKSEYEPRKDGTITVDATSQGKPVANAEVTLYAVDDAILQLGGWTLPSLLDTFYPTHPFNVITHASLEGYLESISPESLTQKGFVVGDAGKDEFGSTRFVRQNFKPLILWLPSVKTGPDGHATAHFTTPDNLTRFRLVALAQTKENQFGSGDTTFTVSKPVLVEPALPRFLRQGDDVDLRAVARQKIQPEDKLTIRCDVGDGLSLSGPQEVDRTAERNDPAVATFRAHVADDATSVTVRFSVNAASGHTDDVLVTIPVISRTIVVHESVAGNTSGPTFAPAAKTPADWLASQGAANVTLSSSEYLPKLMGIPQVLDYPYGCFEQKSSTLLVYTSLPKLLAYLPQPADRDANYRHAVEETLKEFDKSILPDDMLPYWPYGTTGNPFVTIQSAWAVAMAQQAGYDVPESLANALPRALRNMVLRKSRVDVEPTLRAFALFVLSQTGVEADDDLKSAANGLFLNRERLTDEGRAQLAVAMHAWDISPDQQQELIHEIPEHFDPNKSSFNPRTFSSMDRMAAITTWARLLVTPNAPYKELKFELEKMMGNGASLSTQENLWLLIAFNALLGTEPPAKLPADIAPKPDARSSNQTGAAWVNRDLATLKDLTIRNLGKQTSYVIAATRALKPTEQTAVDHGMRVERIVRNLTAPERTGTVQAPFHLGDQVLISFRFHCDRPQDYVAIEAALPAGLEVLNPNLEMIGKFYTIPDDPAAPAAFLSFSEMRDTQTNLFFDSLGSGATSYAVLARATAVGQFSWPSTQMAPMYDSRFYARSAPSECVVVEK